MQSISLVFQSVKRLCINTVEISYLCSTKCHKEQEILVIWSNTTYDGKATNNYRPYNVKPGSILSAVFERVVDLGYESKIVPGTLEDKLYTLLLSAFPTNQISSYIGALTFKVVRDNSSGKRINIKDVDGNYYVITLSSESDQHFIDDIPIKPEIYLHNLLLSQAIEYMLND